MQPKNHLPELTFRCPVDISSLEATHDGHYCHLCEKNVRDFSKVSAEELPYQLELHKDVECGTFRATQLHSPFGNWKDKIVGWYQRVIAPGSFNVAIRPFILFLAFVILVSSGCYRHVRGKKTTLRQVRWE